MPITGKFEADFSDFSSATKGAEANLKSLGTTATATTTQISGLEQATQTGATHISSLHESYTKFDGALNAVGIHIGPQIKAIEDLGGAAGKTAGEIGLLGTAGLVVGAAMAGWDVGRWIAKVTGADAAVSGLTSRLMGWGDLAKETAGAVQDSIDLAFQRTGIHATSAAQALALNTKWAKENQAAAKENAAEVKAAAAAHDKWEASMEAVTAAGKGWQAILADINPKTVEAAQNALKHSANQQDVAIAYKLTDTQMRAVVDSLAAEKKSIDEAAAARRAYNAELMISYNNQVSMLAQQEKASQGHFGIEGQIEQLNKLAVAEDEATAAALARLTNETDRLKVREANEKRQQEIAIQTATLEQQLADQKGATMAREIAAQKDRTKAIEEGAAASNAAAIQQSILNMEAKVEIETWTAGTYAAQAHNQAIKDYQSQLASLNATLKMTAAGSNEDAIAWANAYDKLKTLIAGVNESAGTLNNSIGAWKAQDDAISHYSATLNATTDEVLKLNAAIKLQSNVGGTGQQSNVSGIAQGVANMATTYAQAFATLYGLPGRAAGGPVSAGGAYIVGERGPELFTPNVSGTISPGGGGVQIVINGSVLSTQAELAALVERAMLAAYRRGGNRLPV